MVSTRTFREFLRERGRLILESGDAIELAYAAEKNPEEDTPFLAAADALEEYGYGRVAHAIRFFISPHSSLGDKAAEKSKQADEVDLVMGSAYMEIVNSAGNLGWRALSNENSISFSSIKYSNPPKSLVEGETVVSVIIITYENIRLSTGAVIWSNGGAGIHNYPILQLPKEINLNANQQILIAATAMFLMAREHRGSSNENRLMGSLRHELAVLVNFTPSRNPSAAQMAYLVQFTRQIFHEFRHIKSAFPKRAKEAAQIIKSTLENSRWKRCIAGNLDKAPIYCAHFQKIRDILQENK